MDGEVDDSDNWYIGPRKKKAGSKQLPVGEYQLKCEYNRFKKEVPFEVTAGKINKVHVIFSPFVIGAKCSNGGENVSYEVYASSGQLVYDKKVPCSTMLNIVLDEGKYRVEASVSGGTGEVPFEVGAGKPAKLILDLTNLNHEEEIKADSSNAQETVAVPVTPKKVEVKKSQTSKKENVADAMKQLGAMFGGAGGIRKSIESKPLKAYKESLTVALPFMEKTKVCYDQAKSLEDAKKCDDIANEGSLMAQKKMTEIMGISGKKLKPISQKEWNDEIRDKKVKKETKDLHDAKLTIICIDKGAGMREIQKCVKNNGEFAKKKSDMEQLGGLLQMFGGK